MPNNSHPRSYPDSYPVMVGDIYEVISDRINGIGDPQEGSGHYDLEPGDKIIVMSLEYLEKGQRLPNVFIISRWGKNHPLDLCFFNSNHMKLIEDHSRRA